MLIIQDILVSDDVVKEQFACNLTACLGACCWEGDYGAPLETAELETLVNIYDKVKPFISPAGQAVIEREGAYVFFEDAESYGTPLIDNGPCAYMNYDANGVAQCGIEQAYRAGAIDFIKPISCHLYPIRVSRNDLNQFEALNYDRWEICSAACTRGKAEKIPVYQFVKDALIRHYGAAFYEELDAAAGFLQGRKTPPSPPANI